jgi:hypothetical protein
VKNKKPAGNAKKPVLQDYKKIGSTFVPPLIHRVGPVDYISWASQTLPELIWWDVLADRISYRFAARVAEEIAKYFKPRDNRDSWWAFISDYSRLGPDDVGRLRDHLSHSDILVALMEALSDFLDLYPNCPLARLSDQLPTGIIDISYLERFENRMRTLQHKRSRKAVLVQAQPIYMGFILGRLHVARGLALANFPQVQDYPKTELSKKVGASICAALNGFAGRMLPKYADDVWVHYFWQRSLELRPLDFTGLEKP